MKSSVSSIRSLLRLTAAAVLVLSLSSVGTLVLLRVASDSRVVNVAGLVRGASQRLVKLELAGQPSDALIAKLDQFIPGLIQGDPALGVPAASDAAFREAMNQVAAAWSNLKKDILQARADAQVRATLLPASETYFQLTDTAVSASETASRRKAARVQEIQGGLLALNLVLAGFITSGLTRKIVRPLRNLSDQLNRTSQGLCLTGGEISQASTGLAERAGQQAASLEETSASLEEMSSMTQRSADHAQQANALAQQTRQVADRGAADMQAMAAAMNDIKASSDDIAKIIKTIDEIAFQTNLLALNAAVEAARAGEAGAGFAVVADEVRNLAQRAATAARETASKIEGAIVKTKLGVELNAQVLATLNDIVAKARHVDELVGEIATGAKEQSQGIAQVNIAVSEMDKVTQANAAAAEESAAAAQELSGQAEGMKAAVQDLLCLVDGVCSTTANAVFATAESGSPRLVLPRLNARAGTNGRNGKNGHSAPASPSLAEPRRQTDLSAIPLEGDFKEF